MNQTQTQIGSKIQNVQDIYIYIYIINLQKNLAA